MSKDPFTTEFGFNNYDAASMMVPCLQSLAQSASNIVAKAASNPNDTSYALQAQLAMGSYQQAFNFTTSIVSSGFTTLKEAIQNIR